MNNISSIREKAGRSQQEMAEAAGWTQGRWSSYETGARAPKPDVVKEIISAFASFGVAVTFEDLFGEAQSAA